MKALGQGGLTANDIKFGDQKCLLSVKKSRTQKKKKMENAYSYCNLKPHVTKRLIPTQTYLANRERKS